MNQTQKRVLWVTAAVVLLLGSQVIAQVPTGDLAGRAQDETGAPLPGVTITATSPNLQGSRGGISDGNGNYKVPLLPPGTYRVTYELDGFATAVRDVKINAGASQKSDPVTMTLSTLEEEMAYCGTKDSVCKTVSQPG